MKLTRYFQSCLFIEEGGVRILIDPSGFEAEHFDEFGKPDAVLYTHEHSDHFDAELAQKFAAGGAKMFANESTAKLMKTQPTVVTDGQEFNIKGVKIQAKNLPHCLMWDGTPGPQNTGYVIAGKLFHSGDGVKLAGLSVNIVALPINGPDVSLKDAFDFAKQLSSKVIIPLHYDYLGGNPEVFADVASTMGYTAHVLSGGIAQEV